MKTKTFNALFLILFTFNFSVYAQQKFQPKTVIQGQFVKKTVPFRDMQTVSKTNSIKELKIIEDKLLVNRKENENALPLNGDQIAQNNFGGVQGYSLEQNFDGATIFEGQSSPPDPTGAVGPNHYVHAVNNVVKIFNKTGGLLAGPTTLSNFLGSGNNDGDPIVLYDQLADRFFVSQFKMSNNALIIGVSETSDPTGAYLVYEFPLDAFPDYPHYSIWHNAYFLTANKPSGYKVYAIDRAAMLSGSANPQIVGFDLPGVVAYENWVFSPEPANLLGSTYPEDVPGYITYLQDDGWEGVDFDHLKVWEIDLDWNNTANSTISSPLEIPTVPFESTFAPFGTGDLEQPGTVQKIDMISGVISFAANYRSFEDYNSWLVTFNVDVDGNDTSGIRWIELRNDSANAWSIFQEGTYAPADGNSRFMGSGAIDAQGNIGLAFNIGSVNLPVGIRYTGRFNGDALGQMTVAETTIVNGSGVQTFSNRFGDYSHVTMDPDNFTFWHTAEYFPQDNLWSTRIASFKISAGFSNDVGVNDITTPSSGVLTDSETVTVSIRNFGTTSQTSIPLELRVDDVLIASETFQGTINPNETAIYQFIQTVDLSTVGQTYSVKVSTELTSDEFSPNNSFIKNITHLYANDIGVVAIPSPQTGELDSEPITIEIKNYGTNSQSNFNVSYTLNGGSSVVENVTETVSPGNTISFTFSEFGGFSAIGSHEIVASTLLGSDSDTNNDAYEVTVSNLTCSSTTNATPQEINGVVESVIQVTEDVLVSDVNVTVNINHPLVDNLEINLIAPNNQAILLSKQNGGTGSNYTNTTFDDEATVSIEDGTAPFTGTFKSQGNLSDLYGMQSMGNWKLSVTDLFGNSGGSLINWTLELCSNQTLGVEDFTISQSDIIVVSKPNNNFEVSLITSYDGLAFTGVYNMLGQQLGGKTINKTGDRYVLHIDMSVLSSGVYLVKMGSVESGSFKTAKIIVK